MVFVINVLIKKHFILLFLSIFFAPVSKTTWRNGYLMEWQKADTDQIAPSGTVWSGLHYLHMPICQKRLCTKFWEITVCHIWIAKVQTRVHISTVLSGILCSSTYTTISINSVSRQQGPDQPAQLHRLIWACIVPNLHKGSFHVLHIIWKHKSLQSVNTTIHSG